uniref:FBA_2 domain-containing protein n=1 Tax=Caenorhabditis tropicalis TaxID=1561998 RepID=A0A1I7UTG9_9PELO
MSFSIDILKLPYQAQAATLNQMELLELFLVSTLSKRSKMMVGASSHQNYLLKVSSIGEIWLQRGRETLRVVVHNYNEHWAGLPKIFNTIPVRIKDNVYVYGVDCILMGFFLVHFAQAFNQPPVTFFSKDEITMGAYLHLMQNMRLEVTYGLFYITRSFFLQAILDNCHEKVEIICDEPLDFEYETPVSLEMISIREPGWLQIHEITKLFMNCRIVLIWGPGWYHIYEIIEFLDAWVDGSRIEQAELPCYHHEDISFVARFMVAWSVDSVKLEETIRIPKAYMIEQATTGKKAVVYFDQDKFCLNTRFQLFG